MLKPLLVRIVLALLIWAILLVIAALLGLL
jgi:hypothetical protein